MSYMLDLEGEELPSDKYGPLFDLTLFSHANSISGEPYFSLNIPMFFVTHDWQEYSSGGVLAVNLSEVLNEVITNTEQGEISKEGAKAILDTLTTYTDKLKLLITD